MTAAGLPAWSADRAALLRAMLADRGPAAVDPPALAAGVERTAPAAPPPAPPRDALESDLLGIWRRVLGVESAGIRDSFFALGGHSLVAVRLFAEIWRTLGRELPLSTILQAPTVEAIARLLRQEGQPTASSLVPIQPTGAAPPLFCVHQHSGQVFCYRALAHHLGSGQPVYGLKPDLSGDGAPRRIEDMAARYVETIRAVQPEGPYHLVGYCFGGTVAYEMARQLEAGGEAVGLLALIEAVRPGDGRGALARARQVARRVAFELDAVSHVPRGRRAERLRARAAQVAEGAWRRVVPRRDADDGGPAGDSLAERQIRLVAAAHESAAARYSPGPYGGRITLFKPGRRSAGHYGTSDLGWADLAQGGLTIHEIPCEEATLVNEPTVRALAERLRECVRAG